MTRHQQVKQFLQQFLVIILGILLIGQIAFAQNTQTTDNKADSNLRSSARVNPSTLAMELSVSLGNYPGRSGNSIPVSINYSSKVWGTTRSYTHHERYAVAPTQYYNSIDEHAVDVVSSFAENSSSGWTSSLKPVTVTAELEQYNSFGEIYTPEVDSTEQGPAFQVHRIRIQMPNGSTIEFRKDGDGVYNCQDFPQQCNNNFTGTYLSVDGSGMRFERAQVQSNSEIRDVLYLPNGGRYLFPVQTSAQALSYNVAEKFIDKDGNTTTYDSVNRKWTDTLGREILEPVLGGSAGATQTYNIKGINNANIPYSMVWKNLGNSLESSSIQLKYVGEDKCTNLSNNPVSGESLFKNQPFYVLDDQISNNTRYIKRTRACAGNSSFVHNPSPFNPVVLSEILLPNGQKYEFKYNEFGEITKIIYPTGGYERFVYQHVAPIGVTALEVYTQANRGVSQRFVSFDGATESQIWNYYDGVDGASDAGTTIVAPDGSKTERLLYHSTGSAYGFEDPRNGMVKEERVKDSQGVIRSRTLTDWTVSTATNGFAKRDPRPVRSVSIIIEKDPANSANWQALATMSETEYETPGVNGSTAPTDPRYFAHLNTKQLKTYHYLPISLSTAQSNSNQLVDTIRDQFYQSGQVVNISQTDYLYSESYRTRNLTRLPIETRAKDKNGNLIGKGQISYDETTTYPLLTYSGTTTGWQDPQTNVRANPTTIRTWVKETNSWIETHAQFDTFGNVRKQWDSTNDTSRFIETEYSSDYKYAYPTKIISPAPDSSGVHGTALSSQITKTYDPTTGVTLSVTDANGVTSSIEYDNLVRPKKTIPPAGGNIIEIVPNETVGNLYVTVKSQIDEQNWAEKTTYFDGLGRTYKTKTKDAQGDVFVEVQYDNFGRIKQTSSPYRQGETKLWRKPRYDEANRVVETYAPALDGQTGASLGTVSYEISTVPGFIGISVTGTDASGRKSRSITNALGQVLRMDEPTGSSNALGLIESPTQSTVYSYNDLGQLIKVQQGQQTRYFMHDSLGRVIRVKQPEQIVNTNLTTTGNPENNEWTIGYTYDVLGHVIKVTDARGINVINEYDKAGRPIASCYTKPNAQTTATLCNQLSTSEISSDTPRVDYYYDGKGLASTPNFARGKLTKVTNGISETRYTSFDNTGGVLSSQQITDGQTYDFGYKYNLSGDLIEEEYPSKRVVKNLLKTDGSLAAVSTRRGNGDFKSVATDFSYTAAGGVKAMMLGNGRWETASFNSRHQIEQIGLGNSSTDTSLWKIEYEYGELKETVTGTGTTTTVETAKNIGNIARQTVTVPTTSFVQTFKYDELNRLTEAKETTSGTQNWKQTFGYDRYGNRTGFSQIIGSTQLAINNITRPTIDQDKNRFAAGQGYAYDSNGNLTQDAENRGFTFNGDDKQTVVRDLTIPTSPQNPDANVIGRYYYDGEGKRVKKVTNTETTIFVYDAGGTLAAEYSTQQSQQPTTSYLTTDQLGTPRAITDALGNVIVRRDFMPFGEELGAGVGTRSDTLKYSYLGGDNIRQRFTGYEKDGETLLDFAEARMYQNKHGRFTAVDPLLASAALSNPQTFNRYTYTGNNPVNITDPSGLDWCQVSGGFSFAGKNKSCADGSSDQSNSVIKITGGSYVTEDGRIANPGDLVLLNPNGTLRLITEGALNGQPPTVNASVTISAAEEEVAEAVLEEDAPGVTDHILSAFATVMENNGANIVFSGLLGYEPYNAHTETGQDIGNILTLVQGAYEISTGIATVGAGGATTLVTSPLCLTGVGCAVPAATATITAGGLVAITHGTAVIGNTIYNMSGSNLPGSRAGTTSKGVSGKNPPINQNRQVLHTNGTPGKSQFNPGEDVESLVKRAWEYGKPYFDRNGNLRGKKFIFDRSIGTRNGQPTSTIDVRFSRIHGIHGFPGK